jgi:hypothetical protein
VSADALFILINLEALNDIGVGLTVAQDLSLNEIEVLHILG